MKITDISVQTFRYLSNTVRDSEGHGHPGPEHEASASLTTIHTDEGIEGHFFAGMSKATLDLVRSLLIGADPFYNEKICQLLKERQRLNLTNLTDKHLTTIDCAIWDIKGKATGQPVHKLLGAVRDKAPAYASTMCGDDLENGLATPEDYARYAEWCVKVRGYPAYKLHTWQPPYKGAPNAKKDIAACAAVREAVGADVPLMLDPFHYYSRNDALYLARELEKLDYAWMEEPMDEHSMSSYVWLCENTLLNICGPETAEGKMHTRAEWIKAGACDIVRGGIGDVGGITPLMKIAHLAESFGMNMEVHGGGVGNLHVICAIENTTFYERGLLHPFIDWEKPKPWLNKLADPMDNEGFVHVSQEPGLGQDINFDYIRENLVA